MARKRISDDQRKKLEQQGKIFQDLLALEMKFADETDEFEYVVSNDRRTVVAPPPPEISKYNPNGIHDILTFIEHPYFLGQKLHPWQKLILILLYMGIEGNDKLGISPGNKEGSGCDGCVWEYAKHPEMESAKTWEVTGVYKRAMLPVENSKCLKCTRFDCKLRELRFSALKDSAKDLAEERIYARQEDIECSDQYESMQDLLNNSDMDAEVLKQIHHKLGNKFNELVMVIGRRGGKSMMVSVIALYEIYRLLEMKHPQKKYNLLDHDPITVLNVAVNEDQAQTGIFSKIKPMALSSPYFATKIGKDLDLKIFFLTDADKAENERRRGLGIGELDGSIICRCGHSNAAGLVGGTNWMVIMDEVAAMSGVTKESGIDYRLYEDLTPTIATFGSDGRILVLSQPKEEEGLLFDLYTNRKIDPSTLVVQLPTWVSNPSIPQDWLDEQRAKNPESFPMQYGAQFGSNYTDPFLAPDMISLAFNIRTTPRLEQRPEPFIQYYLHVDPATSSDDYALAVAHVMPSIYANKPPAVMIDHIHYWEPQNKVKINSSDIEEYIIELHSKFKFAQVSFDIWNSQSAIANLQSVGINAVCKPFNKSYQEMIFGTVFELFAENRIFIYNVNTMYHDKKTGKIINLMEVERAKDQLKFLQKKWRGAGFKIEAMSGHKDDIPDCIAAVAYECLHNKIAARIPKTRVVYAGP